MASKTISIPKDVYDKLREERLPEESFGDAINRLIGHQSLSEFYGSWSEETVIQTREAIESSRQRTAERLDRLYK